MSSMEVFKKNLNDVVKESFEEKNPEILNVYLTSLNESDADKRLILEQMLRDTITSLVNAQDDVTLWQEFITYVTGLCRVNICNPTVPVVLLGDVFDMVTLEQCAKLFSYVESNVDVWKEDLFFLPCKNYMLRMCNDLLRRLSQSQDTYFCGRILLFLAKFFPFSERSGLNVVSEFNLENSTEFKADDVAYSKDILASGDDLMEDDTSSDINRPKVDYNIYCKFWALQDFFRNPNQCYNKVHWKTFAAHTSSVLSAFSSFKLDEPQLKRSSETPMETSETEQQHYFPKYLTNQKLLDLQMSDSNFRRYILVQLLITFQYLSTPVKFKLDSFELKAEQSDWVKEITETIYRLIEETPPNGAQFLATVKHILKREEIWNTWKNGGCPAFQKPVGEDDEGVDRKKPTRQRKRKYLGDLMRESAAQGKYYMGNGELTKLWNLFPNNLDACKSKERDFLPSLESYFEESIIQSDPAAGIEEQHKRVNDGNFGWRALRLLARRSPHFFTTHSNNPISKMPEYLEGMIRRIAKDLPISCFENSNINELEQAKSMITIWSEDDEDATVENLVYTLEGLEMLEAAEVFKSSTS